MAQEIYKEGTLKHPKTDNRLKHDPLPNERL